MFSSLSSNGKRSKKKKKRRIIFSSDKFKDIVKQRFINE
jgi:hypothetical protein